MYFTNILYSHIILIEIKKKKKNSLITLFISIQVANDIESMIEVSCFH